MDSKTRKSTGEQMIRTGGHDNEKIRLMLTSARTQIGNEAHSSSVSFLSGFLRGGAFDVPRVVFSPQALRRRFIVASTLFDTSCTLGLCFLPVGCKYVSQ